MFARAIMVAMQIKEGDQVVVTNWRAFTRTGTLCVVQRVTPSGTIKVEYHGRTLQFDADGRGKGVGRDFNMRLLTADDIDKMERQKLVHSIIEARGDDWFALTISDLKVVAGLADKARSLKTSAAPPR